jgi:rod shape-determining protein MreC
MYDKTVRRRRAVFGLLVVCSLILITAYFGEPANGGALHGVQRGVLDVVSPIQDGASRALRPIRNLFGWVGDSVSAKGDLKKARQEKDIWRAQALRNEAAVRQNKSLLNLVGLEQTNTLQPTHPVAANVTGRNPTLWYSQITIDRGRSDGVREGMPVIAADGTRDGAGLIGKVFRAGSNSSIVKLITDSSVSIAARTVNGSSIGDTVPRPGNPNDLILENTRKTDQINRGDAVVTAGTTSSHDALASPYPKDLPIGRVTRIDDQGSETQTVHLRPFVDVRSVEFVAVLTRQVNHNR